MTPTSIAKQLMATLHADLPRLIRIDEYFNGQQADPYEPDSAGAEYRSLAKRAVTNVMPLIVAASCESLYVDSVRPGREIEDRTEKLPEWKHWQVSRLDARQVGVHQDALIFGHSFTVTEERGGKVQTVGLSPLNTTALFRNPGNDETPVAAFTVTDWPSKFNGMLGEATMWDETTEYLVVFKSLEDTSDENFSIQALGPHGSQFCPVTRFSAFLDLAGRTWGVVEPMIILQDRINQTVFDLLVVQSGGAFNVRTATGMAPPYKMTYEVDTVTGEKRLVPELDANGQPIIANIPINAMKMLWAEDKDTKFGTLEGTPLDGYLSSVEDAFKAVTALSQTPPFFLLGSIANLTAEALQASMTALERRVGRFQNVFGESWERVFRLAAELSGVAGAIDDYETEVVWRNTNARAFAVVADGLLKLRQAGAPLEGILSLVPGITRNMLEDWLELAEDEKEEQKEADAAAAQAASIVRNRNASPGSSSGKAAGSSNGSDKVP